ncbi:HTH_Tnp_Tc3_2 domain-containing protein [Trichonephila clavipes]|nr:HTH_Tnp_Tc3_2 domain-containing protein [Trichonephila clavipes]
MRLPYVAKVDRVYPGLVIVQIWSTRFRLVIDRENKQANEAIQSDGQKRDTSVNTMAFHSVVHIRLHRTIDGRNICDLQSRVNEEMDALRTFTLLQTVSNVGAQEMGHNISELAIKFGFSHTIISLVYRKYREPNLRHRCGRKKIMLERDQRRLTRIIKRDRHATLPEIAADFNGGPSTSVTM